MEGQIQDTSLPLMYYPFQKTQTDEGDLFKLQVGTTHPRGLNPKPKVNQGLIPCKPNKENPESFVMVFYFRSLCRNLLEKETGRGRVESQDKRELPTVSLILGTTGSAQYLWSWGKGVSVGILDLYNEN